MQQPLIKVCGLTDHPHNQLVVQSKGVTHAGFIFAAQSPRFVDRTFPTKGVKRTGVFVNASVSGILTCVVTHQLNVVQLHGNESPEMCSELRKQVEVIKAFGITEKADLTGCESYHGTVDLLLFDTKTPQHGGSGRTFDWSLLHAYQGPTPFLLSGGIGLSVLMELRKFRHPFCAGYDLNSRFESSPGIKNHLLIQQFLHELNTITPTSR